MPADFRSSFIPKEPVTEAVFHKKKTGILGMLATTLFIASIVAAGGVYFYKGVVKKDIASLQSELAIQEKNIDKKTITEMSRFAARLNLVKSIVLKHQVVSGVLNSIASSTVSAVYFTSFSYDSFSPNTLTVNLEGKATSYGTVAAQEDIFKKNKDFKSVDVSGLSLEEGGTVIFKASISVDPVDPTVMVFKGDPSLVKTVAQTLKDDEAGSLNEDAGDLNIDDLDSEIESINNL
jgi:hypothetical protein